MRWIGACKSTLVYLHTTSLAPQQPIRILEGHVILLDQVRSNDSGRARNSLLTRGQRSDMRAPVDQDIPLSGSALDIGVCDGQDGQNVHVLVIADDYPEGLDTLHLTLRPPLLRRDTLYPALPS